jgi:hypothetical protein
MGYLQLIGNYHQISSGSSEGVPRLSKADSRQIGVSFGERIKPSCGTRR